MSECTHDCSTCGESCSERQEPQSLLKEHHPEAHIGKVFGIVSGKGGVGKSMVTSQLAVTMRRRGHQVGILDADVTGPSIPKAFGIHGQATGSEAGLYPMVSKTGIQVMSTNLLLPNETDPVIWRGPVISGVVQQFWTDVLWNCDYLFVDMPPGTGDVSLSVFQSIPLDGIVIVASPQELVSMVVEKAVKMAEMMEVPIVGLVENMSYVTCRSCGAPPSARAGGDAHRPGPGRPYRRRRHRVLPGQLAGGCRRLAGGEIMPNAAPCPSTARRLPRFVRPMQIHRRKHLLFVGKNSCKIRQDSR